MRAGLTRTATHLQRLSSAATLNQPGKHVLGASGCSLADAIAALVDAADERRLPHVPFGLTHRDVDTSFVLD